MAKCRYQHEGVETCNIDTTLFKDSSQEDLFPDLCYFHQVGNTINYFYQIFKDEKTKTEIIKSTNSTRSPHYDNNIKQILLFIFFIVNKIPKSEIFYANFAELMKTEWGNNIDLSGFCFPIVTDRNNIILVNSFNQQLILNNTVIWHNINAYSIDFIKTSIIRSISNSLFQTIIANFLTNLYRETQNSDSAIPLIQDHTFGSSFDLDVMVDYIYKNNLLSDIKVKDIFNDALASRVMDRENWLNDKFKSVVIDIVNNINIDKVLSRDNGAYISQKSINHIKEILKEISLNDIKDRINIFYPFENILSNLSSLFDNTDFRDKNNKSLEVQFKNIIFLKNIDIIAGDKDNTYVFDKCNFDSPEISINATTIMIRI